MASAGMLHRGRNTGPDGGDEVQRSIELLDSVLSEFEEGESGGSVGGGGGGGGEAAGGSAPGAPGAAGTPDDDSPSLGGHQSEDDGYMSMNGRRTKFALSFRPTEEKGEPVVVKEGIVDAVSPLNISQASVTSLGGSGEGLEGVEGGEESISPPPPSEAERIICTLLPKVSPSNSSKRSIANDANLSPTSPPPPEAVANCNGNATNNSTQTTLPKTRHQRPYGWEKGSPAVVNVNANNQLNLAPRSRFASLPYATHQQLPPPPPSCTSPPSWLPPRNKLISNPSKRSPSMESPKPVYPLTSAFSYDNDFVLGNMPYNEHPVTIYPGANVPYTKQLNSPTYGPKISPIPKPPPISQDGKKLGRRDNRPEELLSPKSKLPPRTLAGSIERHHEVCRGPADNLTVNNCSKRNSCNSQDEDHFSDDSLEESFPPPPPVTLTPSKRSSIAWEVPLDDDPLLTPGSTKVIGRRRRKSGDHSNSSTSSIPQKVEEWAEGQGDYWPPPPQHCSTEDEVVSPFSDTESEHLPLPEDISEINATGTYIIRRGKKDRKNIPEFAKKPHKPPRNIQQHFQNEATNKNYDGEQSVDGSSLSISAMSMSGSHNSVSSLNSRLSSDLSIPHSRYSIDFNSRFSRELTTPNSRYSVDLCIPSSNHLSKELTSPKSRLSLDLNNSSEKLINRDYFIESPKNKKSQDRCDGFYQNKNSAVPNKLSPQNRFSDFKKYSCTFDNIQSLMKEGIESSNCGALFDETSSELSIIPPSVVRVVSLPILSAETEPPVSRQVLTTTVEEEEDFETPSHSSEDTSPLKKIENNISALLSQGRDAQFSPYMHKDWDIHKDEYSSSSNEQNLLSNITFNSGERRKRNDIQKSSSHNEIPNRKLLDYHRDKNISNKRNGIHKSMSSKDMPVSFNRQTSSDSTGSSGGDFPVHVQIVEHSFKPLPKSPGSPQFPPLPPSPVQEDDDEYSEILQPMEKAHISKSKADTLPTTNSDIYHRSLDPPAIPPHRESGTNSLKTRSMDTSFSKNRRNNNSSNKTMSTDRRTLPSDMGVMSGRRRTFQRQRGREEGTGGGGLQTSASLPETPVFGRGCDIPRTPHRRTTDSGPRQSNTMNSIQTMSGSCTVGGYGRGSTGGSMERALAGAELLRMAGGPARGWYPRQRHRPASIEHLERLPMSASSTSQQSAAWDSTRKPLTLPPNLTPKFFHKSPREALRRVTSLLIRKGNNSKDNKDSTKKDRQAVSPATRSANGEESTQKQRKGFFKNFWKRSRHYSLEHP